MNPKLIILKNVSHTAISYVLVSCKHVVNAVLKRSEGHRAIKDAVPVSLL